MAKKVLIPEKLKEKKSELFEVDGLPFRVNFLPKAGINRLLDWIVKIESGDVFGNDLKTCADIRTGEIRICDAPQVSSDDLATAYWSFVDSCLAYTKPDAMRSALESAQRKKDGSLSLKRVQHLAYIPYGINFEFYELCAVNESDNVLLLEIRKTTCSHRSADAVAGTPSCEEIVKKWGSVLPEKQYGQVTPKEKKVAGAAEKNPAFVIDRKVLKKYTGKEEHVVIPDGVTKIARLAFSMDGTIKRITIPDSVIEIADEFVAVIDNRMAAISSVSARPVIQRIDFPRDIKRIPNLDFNVLLEMTIPDALPASEFYRLGFLNIQKVYARETSDNYKIVDDFVLSKDGKVLYFYPITKTGECRVPDGVETIGENVFSEIGGTQHRVTKVVLPSSVKYIKYKAFDSWHLQEVEIPPNVISIDKYAIFKATIKGKKNSCAEAYAKERNLPFEEI